MNIVLYIDADNVGGENLVGIDLLGKHDKVIMFQNSKCAYSKQHLEEFTANLKCDFVYCKIPLICKNAVDFAIAIEMGTNANDGKICIVVSGDNDLKNIVEIYNETHSPPMPVAIMPTVKTALLYAAPFWIANDNELHKIYNAIYGKKFVNIVINNNRKIFDTAKKEAEKPKKSSQINSLFSLDKLKKGG